MKKFGNTGLIVSEICLGTMTFSSGEGFWKATGKMDLQSAARVEIVEG
jgi:aryl-alcohol dehydrogenase-like predicted oxidoreductase